MGAGAGGVAGVGGRAGSDSAFCAPEVARGGPTTFESDIYSWAASIRSIYASAGVAMPKKVGDAVSKCLDEHPRNRGNTVLEIGTTFLFH